MKNTALLALSSPESSDNYYSQLLTMKDNTTGQPFFRIVDCFMICEECRKLEKDEQIKCKHIKQTAHWLSGRKTDRLLSLYAADPSTAIRELKGMVDDDFTPCFRKEDIERMYAAPPVMIVFAPKYVYVSVDPNGGGPSLMAIVSGYYDPDANFIILGLDAEPVKSHVQIKHTLRRHFEKIRSIPRFRNSILVFIPENNLGNEATHMHSMVKALPNVQTYWQRDDRPGVTKTHSSTMDYQFLLDTKLAHNGVRFDIDLFTTNRKEKLDSVKQNLRGQMERYHYEEQPGNKKVKLTGKMGGDMQDDLLIALMQCIYYGRACMRDPRQIQ